MNRRPITASEPESAGKPGRTPLLTVLSVLADPDALIVDDDQAPNKVSVLYRLQKSIQCLFGLFDGGWPDPKPDDAPVTADYTFACQQSPHRR
jgi:hypothetical protein